MHMQKYLALPHSTFSVLVLPRLSIVQLILMVSFSGGGNNASRGGIEVFLQRVGTIAVGHCTIYRSQFLRV